MKLKQILVLAAALLLATQMALCFLLQSKAQARLVTTTIKLRAISQAMRAYASEHSTRPPNLQALGLCHEILTDPVSNAQFVYTRRSFSGPAGLRVLVCQAESFPTGFLPWGHRSRFALLTDGSIRDVHAWGLPEHE